MSWRFLLTISLCGLAAALIIASMQHTSGYMDAQYYYMSGVQIASGKGFTENIIWNYLSNPVGLPQPSHTYWMPLVSILASLGLLINPGGGYPSARLIFLLISACIPPLTAFLAMRLSQKPQLARLSGLLAIFPVFYLPFLPVTDCFGPLMILGGLYFFLLIPKGEEQFAEPEYKGLTILGLGLLAGFMHLARADGLMWLGVTFLALIASWWLKAGDRRISRLLSALVICLSGYLLVAGPWLIRNLSVFGAPLAQGSSRTLWLREYNELYIYPASKLTFQHLLQSGFAAIFKARLWSAGQNLQTTLAIQGEIFLFPLIILGLWRIRQAFPIRLAIFAWFLMFLTLTLLFPFQSARGGFFHSGAAFQPLFLAVVPVGLETVLEWGSLKRGWQIEKARQVFGSGLVMLAIFVTMIISYNHLFESGTTRLVWDAVEDKYRQVELYLVSQDGNRQDIVMVNNPPGYYAASSRPAISIPFADLECICLAAWRYHAHYLLLEINQIPAEPELFSQPANRLCLNYLDTIADVRVYRVGDQ